MGQVESHNVLRKVAHSAGWCDYVIYVLVNVCFGTFTHLCGYRNTIESRKMALLTFFNDDFHWKLAEKILTRLTADKTKLVWFRKYVGSKRYLERAQ